MRQKVLVIGFILLFPIIVFSQKKDAAVIRLFYLGGQSNMVGHGYVSDLPESLNQQFENVWIFSGNPAGDGKLNGGLGKWELLKPGYGTGFSSDGKNNNLSPRFGVELSFAKRMQALYPNDKIAIIKYAKGGTSIDSMAASHFGCWEPDFTGTNGVNQYDHFLATVRNAMMEKDIDGDKREDFLIPSGIIWMQGESDAAHTEEIAARYYVNLKRLIDLIRATFHTDDLPVVIGKISDSWNDVDGKVWDFCELVQYAQEKYAKTDGNAAIIRNTRYYKNSDPWHYDSAGYIDLGEKFAEALFQLNTKK